MSLTLPDIHFLDLLRDLAVAGVRLAAEPASDRLRFWPKSIPDELVDRLRLHKPRLLTMLAEVRTDGAERGTPAWLRATADAMMAEGVPVVDAEPIDWNAEAALIDEMIRTADRATEQKLKGRAA